MGDPESMRNSNSDTATLSTRPASEPPFTPNTSHPFIMVTPSSNSINTQTHNFQRRHNAHLEFWNRNTKGKIDLWLKKYICIATQKSVDLSLLEAVWNNGWLYLYVETPGTWQPRLSRLSLGVKNEVYPRRADGEPILWNWVGCPVGSLAPPSYRCHLYGDIEQIPPSLVFTVIW